MQKRIFWHHGLFLQPQHFQYQEQCFASSLDKVWKTLSGDHWGVLNVVLDPVRLSECLISIQSGGFVFMDGTWVTVGENIVVDPLNLSVEEFGEDNELTLYIVISAQQTNQNGVGSRFADVESKVSISDQYQGGDPVEVPVVTYRARVCLKHDIQSQNPVTDQIYIQPEEQSIPFARVKWRNEQLEQDVDFIPPCLNVGGVPAMDTMVSGILKELLDRCRQLEEYKGGQGNSEFSSRILRYRLALQTLSKYVAQLDHLSSSAKSVPDDVYLCLKQLLAEISCFSRNTDVLGQKGADSSPLSYEHARANSSFKRMKAAILSVLNELTIRPEKLVRMVSVADDLMQTAVPPEFLKNLHLVYIIIKTSVPVSEWQTNLQDFAKLAPTSLMPVLTNKAIPGIELIAELGRPEGLPHRPSSMYYRLNIQSSAELIQSLKQEGELSLYWNGHPEDVSVELVLLEG